MQMKPGMHGGMCSFIDFCPRYLHEQTPLQFKFRRLFFQGGVTVRATKAAMIYYWVTFRISMDREVNCE